MEEIYEKSEYIFEIGEVQSFRKIWFEKFWPSRKILHFFHLHFSSSFSKSLKIFIALNYATQNYLFNEVLPLILYFYLQEQLSKIYGLSIFLKYTLSINLTFDIFQNHNRTTFAWNAKLIKNILKMFGRSSNSPSKLFSYA